MGLMNRAARMAARHGRPAITEDDIYAAMENKAMEAQQASRRFAFGLEGHASAAGACHSATLSFPAAGAS